MSLDERRPPPSLPDARGGDTSLRIATSVQIAVREQIRREILTGVLAGGTRLLQADLATRYGRSITPVREALRDLAAERLVDINPFSGALVHSPTLKELEDIYQVRAELVPLTVQGAMRCITGDELDHAEALVKAMSETSEADVWVERNRQFHHLLDGASRNEQLAETMRRLADLSAMYVALSIGSEATRRSHANDDHQELVNAYRKRDTDSGIAITLRHIAETQELVNRAFRQKALADGRREGSIFRSSEA